MSSSSLSINPRKRVLGAATENRSLMRETQACVYDAITQAIIDNAGAMFFILLSSSDAENNSFFSR